MATTPPYINQAEGTGIAQDVITSNIPKILALFQSTVAYGYQGSISLSSPAPTVAGVYIPTESGTYTNAGSQVVDLTAGFTYLLRDSSGNYTKVVVPAPFASYLLKTNFGSALDTEIARGASTTTRIFGTTTTGTSNDTPGSSTQFKFTSPIDTVDTTGTLTQITIPIQTAGTVVFAIGTSSGGFFTARKLLASQNVTVGANTLTFSEAINAGETVALAGGTCKVYFGASGLPGSTLVQQFAPGGGAQSVGGAGSYYSYGFTVSVPIPASTLYSVFLTQALAASTYLRQDGFTAALAAEVIRNAVSPVTYGTTLLGTATDTLDGTLAKFTSVVDKVTTSGTISTVTVQIAAAGTLYFCIGTSSGITTSDRFNFRKQNIGPFNVAVGANTLTLNEPISVGETLALFNGTAQIKYGGGLTGSNFVQQGTGYSAIGAAGSYYAYSFIVNIPASKPLDIYQTKPVNVFIRAKRNGTVGVDCEFTGNRAIQDAIESINDSAALKTYTITVEGVFEALAAADYNANALTNTAGNNGIYVSFVNPGTRNYISLRGVGRSRAVINCSLPDNLGTTFQYDRFEGVYWQNQTGTFENITVTGKNLRYPIHTDAGQLGAQNYAQKFRNVRIEHYGNTNNAAAVWVSYHPHGIGFSDGQTIEYDGCLMRSAEYPLYMHTNANFAKEIIFKIRNSRFEHTGNTKTIAQFQSLGSHRDDEIILENNAFEGGYIIDANDNPYIPTALADQSFNHCDFRIKGAGNSPFLYRPNFNGKVLRITSKSTGTNSTVYFDSTTTGFAAILKDPNFVTGTSQQIGDLGEVMANGFAFRNGDVGLSGFAEGRLDIGGEAYGLASNTYGKSLGQRLGDCSTTNKTLIVTIDGTSYTITFNKNYKGAGSASVASDYSNAQIIAEINAVIGTVATVTEWSVGNNYYPELSDVMQRAKSSEVILKGMAVYNNNGLVRKALSTDTSIYGIALDDFINGGYGRVLIKGLLSTIETDRFSTLQATYTAINQGDQLGVSATVPGKLDKAATVKFFTAIANNVIGFKI